MSALVRPQRAGSRINDQVMWALFTDGQQVSRTFRTEQEAWHQARKCGLADGDTLERGYEIRRIEGKTKVA